MERKKTGGAVPHISKKDIEEFQIPLPSLRTQERLVRVLDNFDAICQDLEIGLPAEISARKKQYEYYRDQLLNFAQFGAINQSINQSIRDALIKLIRFVFGWYPALCAQFCPDGVECKPLWSVTIWDKKFQSVEKSKQSKIINYPYLLASELFALEQEGGDVFLLSTGEKT